MRVILPAAAALIFSMGASAQTYSHEANTYRHGGTYSTVQSSSEQSCAETCRADTQCLVWSFRKPQTGVGPSQCELKQSIGYAENNPTMTSGISPRFASQHQAAPRPEVSNGLLGGVVSQTQAPAAPRALQISADHAPVSTAPTPTRPVRRQRASTSTTYSAAPSRPSGRVLSPDDPRIVRQGTRTRTVAVPAATPAAVPATAAPVRQVAPAPRPQTRTAVRQRPYDNLRNREFPQYSVQDDSAFDSETVIDGATEAATNTVGAGS